MKIGHTQILTRVHNEEVSGVYIPWIRTVCCCCSVCKDQFVAFSSIWNDILVC